MSYQSISIITMSSKQVGAKFLKKNFPNGPIQGKSPIAAARAFVATGINVLNQLLEKEGSQVRLSINIDQRNAPNGLIVFDDLKTLVVDMAVSPSLVQLAGKPTFLIHPNAGPFLLDALITAAMDVVDGKHKVAA